MNFNFPFFDVLVIPIGATSGRRIVIDGVNGMIQFYDENDDLRIQLGGPGGFSDVIQLSSGDTAENIAAGLYASIFGAGVTRNLNLNLESPQFTPQNDQSFLLVGSESFDGTELPRITLQTGEIHVITSATFPVELLMQIAAAGTMKAIGRGIIAQQPETTDDGPFTTDSATDFALNNVPVIANHIYAVHLHVLAELSAAAGQWNIFLRVNGANVGRFDRLLGTEVQRPMVDATLYWTAPTTQNTDDFTVFVDEVIAGADLTFLGTADDLVRTFTITDLGKLP